jgi:mRNA interferase MazF
MMANISFPKNGEVWYVDLPNQPNDPQKPRTAIIVSTDGRNRTCGDVVVVPTASAEKFNLHPLYHVQIPAGEGGLLKDSIARCDQITTLDKNFLARGPLGERISLKFSWKIINAVRASLGDTTV